MIFINNNLYAKVWKIDRKEKYTDLNISTSEKDREGNYINSSWYPRAIGHAHNSLKDVKEGDRITIKQGKLSMDPYEKDGVKKYAFRFLILSAEINEDNKQNPDTKSDTSTEENTQGSETEEDDEELPF